MRSQVKGETKGKHLILTLDNIPSLLYNRRADLVYLGSYSVREKEAKAVAENNYVYLFVHSNCSVCCRCKREHVPRCCEQREVTVSARRLIGWWRDALAGRQQTGSQSRRAAPQLYIHTADLQAHIWLKLEVWRERSPKNENVVIICTPTFLELHRKKALQHSATAEGEHKGVNCSFKPLEEYVWRMMKHISNQRKQPPVLCTFSVCP